VIDIAISPTERRKRKLRRWGLAGVVALVLLLAAIFILRLAPAGPSVAKANLWIATVQKGRFSVTVSAPGTLVPRKIRVVTAGAPGTVQEKLVEPGDRVTTGSILAILSNPDLGDQVIEARSRLANAQASLVSQEASLDDHLLNLEDTLSQVQSEAQAARLKAQAEKSLLAEQVVGSLQYTRSRLTAASLAREVELTHERIADFRKNEAAQIHAQKARIASLKAAYRSEEHELASLKVRAGLAGVVQSVAVQEGQRVILGSGIAKIAGMHALKARLEVPASEAAEVALGQRVDLALDTGSEQHLVAVVTRVSPSVQGGTVTVDAEPKTPLPTDARPNLAINGIITITTLADAVYVERPAYSASHKTMTLYRLSQSGREAIPVLVRFGRASSNAIQILKGLEPGERVIVSDTSGFAGAPRIRIRG
jgi:HlyD family secretion protein